MKFEKTNYLQGVLDSHKMKHVDDLIKSYQGKRKQIKEALERQYGKDIYSPINSGSYAKHTAINTKFDLDIAAPFKKKKFSTLEEMFDDVYNFFDRVYRYDDPDFSEVRKQGVSIGLKFIKDFKMLDIDIVPGRELRGDSYSEDKYMNLHANDNSSESQQSIQTNITQQIDHIKGKNAERECIRLMKIWKTQNQKKYIKSFLVELIVVRAFDNSNDIPTGLWDKLKMVLEFIRDNIEHVRLVDPGNSNNVVSDTMTKSQKREFKDDVKKILDKVEWRVENLKLYFKENPKFPSTRNNGYTRTGAGAATLGTNSFG